MPAVTTVSDPTTSRARGALIVRVDLIGTGVFVASAVIAAIVFTDPVTALAAGVAIVLFLGGIVTFLWSFWRAVQRSRGEQVAVTQLYLLTGGVAPSGVRRAMLSALGLQCIVGLGTALARPNADDGSAGTSLALGVLVPLFGFGLNGLWAASHGEYRDRADSIDQNEHHG